MSRSGEIRAVIARHRGQGPGAGLLGQAVRLRLGNGAPAHEVAEAIGFCREIIEAVPVLLDRLREEAAKQGIGPLVEPLVAHAEGYFLRSVDALPEATFGELGLLDDAYLALSIVRLAGQGQVGLVRVELDGPLRFLEQLLGETLIGQLKAEKDRALDALAARAKALEAAEHARRQAPRPTTVVPRSGGVQAGRQLCTACRGIGSTDCPSCGGHGQHTRSYSRIDWQGNVEYVTERTPCGCSAGRVICPRCHGSGYR